MKSQNFFFVFVILLISLQFSFGQEKPEAILVDEFAAEPCDGFLSRTDVFFAQLQNHPDSQGYAVISGANDGLRRKTGYELLIKGAMAVRNFDGGRVILIRGAEAEEFKIQFWKVPPGALKPDFNEGKWNFAFPLKSKPFRFYDNAADDICPPTSFEKIYAEYLNANPQSRGHIVVYAKSLKRYNKLKRDAQVLLKDIPSNRVRFFHVKKDFSNNYANTEYWLVPNKNN